MTPATPRRHAKPIVPLLECNMRSANQHICNRYRHLVVNGKLNVSESIWEPIYHVASKLLIASRQFAVLSARSGPGSGSSEVDSAASSELSLRSASGSTLSSTSAHTAVSGPCHQPGAERFRFNTSLGGPNSDEGLLVGVHSRRDNLVVFDPE